MEKINLSNGQISQYLEKLAEKFRIRGELQSGMLVPKSTSAPWRAYEIDDPQVHRKLAYDNPNLPKGHIPFKVIRKALQDNSKESIDEIFEDAEVREDASFPIYSAKFSKAVQKGVGSCVEHAVLVQLAAQECWKSYIMIGRMTTDNKESDVNHAFNIILLGNAPFW